MNLLALIVLSGLELHGAGNGSGFPLTAGGFVRATAGREVWGDDAHGGRLEVGVQLGHDYQSYQWIGYLGPGERLTGGEHRTHLWLVAGHAAHRGRFTVMVHALAGLSHQEIGGVFTNAGEEISGGFATSSTRFAFGVSFGFGALIGKQWGAALHVAGFPIASTWPATGYFSGGLGLFLRL